jgi:NADPH:quinone reductase
MKAIVLETPGGPDAMRYVDIDDPMPGPGQVLIRVEAAGVNFIDVYQRTGLYTIRLPAVLGQEAAGRIVEVGPDVPETAPGLVPGDAVAFQGMMGAYAELAVAPAERLLSVPPGITTRQAAASMLQGMTAQYLATSTYPLKRGDACLVHAAAGGVGLLLCQIAKLRGARVIGTVSTVEKAKLAREAGADEVILYTDQDFEGEARRMTDGAGVQVVYDSVGRTTFEKSLRSLAHRGTLVLYGQSSGPVEPFDPQLLNRHGSLFLTRPTLHHYTSTRAELADRASEIFGWIRDGHLKVRVDRELPLAEAAEAHRLLEARRTSGKVLLIP